MAQRPRGTRDFAPEEMVFRNQVADRMRGVFRRFGYREVQTPVFEELELFTAKSGPGIVDELYDFVDKGERRMTLRPELTAPAMRMYFNEHAFDPKPVKWSYFGACYRYDRPQSGRYREFWQFGCEQIGAGTPLAYAELIALAEALFDEVGLTARETAVGHVGVLRDLVDGLGLDAEGRGAAMRAIDKGDRDGLKALAAQHDASSDALDRLTAALDADSLEAARAAVGDHDGLDELASVLGHLSAFGGSAQVDLGIARGLDYYTSIVFETHCPVLEAQSQVLGGGGYDLSALFDGQPTPTMGFGLGFDRTLVALEKTGMEPPELLGPHVYFGALGEAAAGPVIQYATALRERGACVEIDLMGRKPGAIAKAADAAGATRLVILGDRDLESGHAQVKHLRSGETHQVPLEGLVDDLVTRSEGDLRGYS